MEENVNNSKLIELIDKLKEEKSMEAQNKVISEVLRSRFMCPVILESAPKGGGKIQVGKETKIQFSIIKTKEEKNFLIAFTSEPEVHKWQKQNNCDYEAGRNCKRNSPNVWSNDTDALFRLAFQVQRTSVFLCCG